MNKSRLILLAEDNPDNIIVISDYLTIKGYELIIAENGQKAIELIESDNPDLILMDIQMPGMDGLTAIKLIRQTLSPPLCDIPIIALTALVMEGDREKCLEAGANEYLSKPVRLSQLVKIIEEMLGD